ncbi:MAG: hypothetical protein WC850_00170 [Candidatus Gracilibacteria bacterium]
MVYINDFLSTIDIVVLRKVFIFIFLFIIFVLNQYYKIENFKFVRIKKQKRVSNPYFDGDIKFPVIGFNTNNDNYKAFYEAFEDIETLIEWGVEFELDYIIDSDLYKFNAEKIDNRFNFEKNNIKISLNELRNIIIILDGKDSYVSTNISGLIDEIFDRYN